MDQQVPERDDPSEVRHPSGEFRRRVAELPERLTDDLELPLHCRAKQWVRLVLGPRSIGDELDNQRSGASGVPR